jgi:hypothetical protein
MAKFIFNLFQIGMALLLLGSLAEVTMTLRHEAAKVHAHGLMNLGHWNSKLISK